MQAFIDNTVREVGTAFLRIDLIEQSFLHKIIAKQKIILEAIVKIETTVEAKPFKSNEVEIDYFKNQKPRLLRYLIYYENIIRIEQHFPIGTKKQVNYYLKKEQNSLSNFYIRNKTLFTYARCNHTHLDHINFNKSNLNKDFMATVYAAEMLQEYLKEKKIQVQKNQLSKQPLPQPSISTLKWTDTQAGLVELVYAIYAKGCINNGKATIKAIIEFFEALFNISLTEYRRTFQDIKNRHQPDRFLNKLAYALTQRIDSSFE